MKLWENENGGSWRHHVKMREYEVLCGALEHDYMLIQRSTVLRFDPSVTVPTIRDSIEQKASGEPPSAP